MISVCLSTLKSDYILSFVQMKLLVVCHKYQFVSFIASDNYS